MTGLDRLPTVPLSIAAGVVLTLLSGVVPLRTLAGGTHYGFPMAWLVRRVLAPEYFPWRVARLGLVVDLFVWTALAYAALRVYATVASGRGEAA